MTGRRMESDLEKSTISEHVVYLGNHDSVNSDEAVSSTNRLKAFILKAFHGLLNSLKRAVIKAKESISKALDHLVKSDEALSFFEAFHGLLAFLVSLLAALIGLHFQVLGVSPLDTHFAFILLFIMAIIVYSIAYAEIKLQPLDAGLPIFKFICLVSGIIAIELLVAIIVSPFWLFMENLCPILIIGVLHHSSQQSYQWLYYTVNLLLNGVCGLFKKIYQSVYQINNWLLQKFQKAASAAFYSVFVGK